MHTFIRKYERFTYFYLIQYNGYIINNTDYMIITDGNFLYPINLSKANSQIFNELIYKYSINDLVPKFYTFKFPYTRMVDMVKNVRVDFDQITKLS